MHGAPIGEVTGQRPPLAAQAQQVQHRAPHLIQLNGAGFGLLACTLQQWLNDLESLAAHVAGVFFCFAACNCLCAIKDREHVLKNWALSTGLPDPGPREPTAW